jgi:hypothetical protein
MGVARDINYFQFGVANKGHVAKISLVFLRVCRPGACGTEPAEIGIEPPGSQGFWFLGESAATRQISAVNTAVDFDFKSGSG